jgi:hypothetical protein
VWEIISWCALDIYTTCLHWLIQVRRDNTAGKRSYGTQMNIHQRKEHTPKKTLSNFLFAAMNTILCAVHLGGCQRMKLFVERVRVGLDNTFPFHSDLSLINHGCK